MENRAYIGFQFLNLGASVKEFIQIYLMLKPIIILAVLGLVSGLEQLTATSC